jgi:hypothetical protein
MKTSELTGAALDWAVAKCEYEWVGDGVDDNCPDYSTDWAHGGEIIEREMIELVPVSGALWEAYKRDQHIPNDGATPLIAAMRCYVASQLGDDIEVPNELINL